MAETMTVEGLEFVMENRAVGEDGGPSIRVQGAVEGRPVEMLRFDMFFKVPHYHYDPNGTDLRYDLDPLTHGDTIGWVMEQFRERLPQMVAQRATRRCPRPLIRGRWLPPCRRSSDDGGLFQ